MLTCIHTYIKHTYIHNYVHEYLKSNTTYLSYYFHPPSKQRNIYHLAYRENFFRVCNLSDNQSQWTVSTRNVFSQLTSLIYVETFFMLKILDRTQPKLFLSVDNSRIDFSVSRFFLIKKNSLVELSQTLILGWIRSERFSLVEFCRMSFLDHT